MTTTAKQNISRAVQLFSLITFLSFLSACGSENTPAPTETNKSTLALPSPLQKLTLNGGTLRAFLILDNDQLNPFEMDINTDGEGSATVVIPNLSRATHNIVITYEYTEAGNTITLAELNTNVDLSSGNRDLNILAGAYDLNFDKDLDGVNNAAELLAQTDPFISDLVLAGGFTLVTETDIPQLPDTATGTLRGFISIDGGPRREIPLEAGATLANIDVPNLSPTEHNVRIFFEYDDGNNNGPFIIVEANRAVDMRTRGADITIETIEFDATPFDVDNDGNNNFLELTRNTDVRALNIPFNAAALSINTELLNTLRFSWVDEPDATFYQLLESKEGTAPFTPIDANISDGVQFKAVDHVVTRPLFDHINDKYKLLSCNGEGCSESEVIDGAESLIGAINYLKSDGSPNKFNTPTKFGYSVSLSADGKTMAVGDTTILSATYVDPDRPASGTVTIFNNVNGEWVQQDRFSPIEATEEDGFGRDVALSKDGNTLVVSAYIDNNDLQGIIHTTDTNPPPRNEAAIHSGAVYVYTRTNNSWNEQAFIKASNSSTEDHFGSDVSISANGDTLVIGAESVNNRTGAAYIFTRNINTWSQQQIITASNADFGDNFGANNSISDDGLTIAVAAPGESSQGTGIDNNIINETPPSQTDNSATRSGAIYVFTLDTQSTPSTWNQQAYIKTDTTEAGDAIGGGQRNIITNFIDLSDTLTLSSNGDTLAISAVQEDSNNRSDPTDNLAENSGAVYVFERSNSIWTQQDYIKPDTINIDARFGSSIELSSDGKTLAIGAPKDNSGGKAFSGTQINPVIQSGAAYLFARDTNGKWTQKTLIKASNTDVRDGFGSTLSLSSDASTLVVGAPKESSSATGINGNQQNNDGGNDGAVYVY